MQTCGQHNHFPDILELPQRSKSECHISSGVPQQAALSPRETHGRSEMLVEAPHRAAEAKEVDMTAELKSEKLQVRNATLMGSGCKSSLLVRC